jgi:hypothetical protein
MEFQNETGFAARMFRGEPEPDIMLVTVVVKASFHIMGDALKPPDADGVEISESDVENPFGYLPSDQVPLKSGVDLFVLGNAYAPGQRPTTRMRVSFRLGSLERGILVVGDRQWRTPLEFTPPRPFVKMPITYCNAFGGQAEIQGRMVPCPDNPLGKGFILERDKAPGQQLPNLESPDHPISSWKDQPTPVGFAPFPRQTRIHIQRCSKILDEASARYEFVPQMFSSAHPDMIVPELEPGLECTLTGMTPDGRLRFRVPNLRLVLQVILGTRQSRFPLRVDTLCILPEELRVVVTGRASFRYRFVAEEARAVVLQWDSAQRG